MRILVLEDERDIAEGVVDLLRADRYETVWARDLAEATSALAEAPFDLALLDVMIGGDEDAGFDFAASLRDADFPGPILFLTARDAIDDRVRGLNLGGDDYLVKPFSLIELRARVQALLRRGAQTKRSLLQRDPLVVDLDARRVWWEGREVVLTDREFAMVELFAHFPERVFPVEELVDRFFPVAESGPRVVRVYVSQLRQKVNERLITTVSGGYRLGPAS